jgi:hypothetical protein
MFQGVTMPESRKKSDAINSLVAADVIGDPEECLRVNRAAHHLYAYAIPKGPSTHGFRYHP